MDIYWYIAFALRVCGERKGITTQPALIVPTANTERKKRRVSC